MKRKKRVIQFDATGDSGNAMHQVLNIYAHAAYPEGGSNCAAVTRTALLEVAENLLMNDQVEISSRQRPMLKSAVNWYFSEVDKNSEGLQRMLLSQLQKPARAS